MIIFGNNTQQANNTSYSFNNNGNFLLVGVSTSTAGASAVSFNGVALTQIGTTINNTSAARYINLWGLNNAPQGSYTLAITGTTPDSAVISMQNVHTTNPYTGTSSNTGTSTSPSLAITTTTANAYVVGFEFSANTGTAGANTTLVSPSSYMAIYRSTNTVSNTSATLNVTITSTMWTFIGTGFNPNTMGLLMYM